MSAPLRCGARAMTGERAAAPRGLAGQLLIAMPSLADPNFHRTVGLLCEHNEQGALGVVINRAMDMTVAEVLEQFGLRTDNAVLAAKPVFLGGPVQTERGFVVHDGDRDFDTTLRITPDLAVTTSRDVLEQIAAGTGPRRTLVALGYSGWAGGQLEQELAENSWLSAPADHGVLFDTAPEQRWDAAAGLLGIDIHLLSGEVGHA